MRREHRAIGARLTGLRRLAASPAAATASHERLERALDRFLRVWAPRLGAHLDVERRLVTPRVVGSLPAETWTLDTFQRERETFDALFDLLRDGRGWLERHEPGAEHEVAATLDDLSSLWGQHVRRLDVIGPLLASLEGPHRA